MSTKIRPEAYLILRRELGAGSFALLLCAAFGVTLLLGAPSKTLLPLIGIASGIGYSVATWITLRRNGDWGKYVGPAVVSFVLAGSAFFTALLLRAA